MDQMTWDNILCNAWKRDMPMGLVFAPSASGFQQSDGSTIYRSASAEVVRNTLERWRCKRLDPFDRQQGRHSCGSVRCA